MGHLTDLATEIHQINVEHGFWETERNVGEMIALMHSELSEALEEHRSNKPLVYVPEHHCGATDTHSCDDNACQMRQACFDPRCKAEGMAVELVDTMIRILDTLGQRGVNIDELLAWKVAYNAGRPYKHGRRY